MRPGDRELAERLASVLVAYDQRVKRLPGIRDHHSHDAFIEQLVESIRRVKYVRLIRTRDLSARSSDPSEKSFDPLKAAILVQREGAIDEAFWLIFLFVHFGKHHRAGWLYARKVYGRLGNPIWWNWSQTSSDPVAFRNWLDAGQNELKRIPGGFGNHRKYESLDAYSEHGTGAAVESYVRWVNPPKTHQDLTEEAVQQAGGDPKTAFDLLYKSMNDVTRFGRTARFDYLCMIWKLGLAPIEPGSAYMSGATGPISGARLLFAGDKAASIGPGKLDAWLITLDSDLKVGMQVLEDALCNWQKNPQVFIPFRG